MNTKAEQQTARNLRQNLPQTKSARLKLASLLRPHAPKKEQKTWTQKRLGKLGLERLTNILVGWALRAQKGKVKHAPALLGSSTACLDERGKTATPQDIFTMPMDFTGQDISCKKCREACGLLSDEEMADLLRQEEEELRAEQAPKRPTKPSDPNRAKRTKKGRSINESRFNSLSDGPDNTILITRRYKGVDYSARLNQDGTVRLHSGQAVASLSKAGTLLTGMPTCNGWRFWNLPNGEGADWLRQADAEVPFEKLAA